MGVNGNLELNDGDLNVYNRKKDRSKNNASSVDSWGCKGMLSVDLSYFHEGAFGNVKCRVGAFTMYLL